ncbi:hypothetical protein NS263_04285 [Curtobacterium oceanosedimentum]|uniref:DUF6286 domain-containing protein n=1 Tax=Curtobacterium oceanosedimentum TaxID=465820 RepID=A0ABR5S9N1_9MICO|nr:DUF6286 domain-containing protein [Curtobacterium oceanosedimentum]KTR41577.1 hypothetical protein NS263_04285 [Curtobacterium oceanosedimentum]
MSTEQLEKRLRRRSIHRSRSTALAITLIIVVVVAAWIGTEAVLKAIGQRPLLADPQTVADTALQPDAAFTTIAEVIAAVLVILGIILIVLAVKPGRQPRSGIDRDRGAVVIDTRILASTAANAAALAAGVPESNTSASARGHHTEVHVVPLSGIPVDRTRVEQAVQDRLGRLGGKHGRSVKVTVEQKGTLA